MPRPQRLLQERPPKWTAAPPSSELRIDGVPVLERCGGCRRLLGRVLLIELEEGGLVEVVFARLDFALPLDEFDPVGYKVALHLGKILLPFGQRFLLGYKVLRV